MKNYISCIFLIITIIITSCSSEKNYDKRAPFPEEINSKIGRGLVCFNIDNSNYLTWRKLPQDSNTYTVWRKISSAKSDKIVAISKTESTFYIDSDIDENFTYFYAVTKGAIPISKQFEQIGENTVTRNGYPALSYNLQESYKQARIVTGDLNGNGELEVVIAYSNTKAVDPTPTGWIKSDAKYYVSAFTKYGKMLWTIDLGWGIEAGPVYAPLVVWDIDADGKSEIILKTNKSDDPLNYNQEYLSILDGYTGKLRRETRWPVPQSGSYNSDSRNYLAIAHLNGKDVSIIAARGLYSAQILVAFDNQLNKRWERKLGTDIVNKFDNKLLMRIWAKISNDQSRGSHSLPIADIDENGSEEILWGEHCITEEGDDLWSIEEKMPYIGHPDIVFSADIYKDLPGKETYYCREGWFGKRDNIGMMLVDKFGETIWANWNFTHVDGGWAANVIPDNKSCQFFAYDVEKKNWKPGQHEYINPSQYLFNYSGKIISHPDSSWIRSFTVDWEGDNIKEICTVEGELKRYNNELIAAFGKGIYWGGDLFGDHREELVFAPGGEKVYIIFNSSELTVRPSITKLADRQYKNDLSRTAMQFNVIPTESGYIPQLAN